MASQVWKQNWSIFLALFLGSQVKPECELGQHRSRRVKEGKNPQKLLLQGSCRKKLMDLAQPCRVFLKGNAGF